MYRVPYDRGHLEFGLPADMCGHVAESRAVQPVADAEAAVRAALAAPIASPPLRAMARPGDRVCIVFTDGTRASPERLLVPALLLEIEVAGVRDADVVLLCGTGMHRPLTLAEKRARLGEAVVARYRVIDHAPQDGAMLVDLGRTRAGVPISIHRAAVEAHLLVATGLVEPHQYAGYSGGRKTVAIGAAGEATIACTHGPAFLDHPGTALGRLDGNPFHDAIAEAARRAGLRFILNAVVDGAGGILSIAAGEPDAAHRDLVRFARSVYEVAVPRVYDVAVAGVGHPKDVNLYQASRAACYLQNAPTPVVRSGGMLIVPARCPEGAGEGVGERRFLAAMRDAPDVGAIIRRARAEGYPPGQQRAYVLAKVLSEARVVIVGSDCPDVVTACKMTPAATMSEALDLARASLGAALAVLVVPHAVQTLPVVDVAGAAAADPHHSS